MLGLSRLPLVRQGGCKKQRGSGQGGRNPEHADVFEL